MSEEEKQEQEQLPKKTDSKPEEGEKYMTFLEHLEELRRCLLVSVGAIAIATILGFVFSIPLLKFFQRPLGASLQLHTSSFVETFTVCLKVGLIAGIFISFPVVFHQLWRFISPGLYRHERKSLLPFIISAWICFIAGGLFAYFIMLPLALRMMVQFTPDFIQNTWFITKYISIVLMMMVACGILFDLPLVILLLSKLGLIDPYKLGKYRGYALLFSFVFAAVLTPPDPITQTMLGAPLYILFEVSVWLSRMLGYGKKDKANGKEKDNKGPKD